MPNLKTTFVAGQLYPRESNESARQMLTRLKASIPALEILGATEPPAAPSKWLASRWERLIVWDDVEKSASSAFHWSPAQFDAGRPHSRLSDWIEYPWGAPDQVILPGFHTAG